MTRPAEAEPSPGVPQRLEQPQPTAASRPPSWEEVDRARNDEPHIWAGTVSDPAMSHARRAYRLTPPRHDQIAELNQLLEAAHTRPRTRPEDWLTGYRDIVGMVCRLPNPDQHRPDPRILVLASRGTVCVGEAALMRSGTELGDYLVDADNTIEKLVESWIAEDPEHAARLTHLSRA